MCYRFGGEHALTYAGDLPRASACAGARAPLPIPTGDEPCQRGFYCGIPSAEPKISRSDFCVYLTQTKV